MNEKTLYKKFLRAFKKDFLVLNKNFSTTLEGLKIPDRLLVQFFENYEKPSLFYFLKRIKDIIFAKNLSEFILKNFNEDTDLAIYLKFLKEEGIIEIKRNGQVEIKNRELLKTIPPPQTEKKIREKIEKKLKVKIKENDFVINIFKKEFKFFPDINFDQMPISQGSAIFLAKKILEYLPLKKKFLFVGDDDFISVILTLSDPEIECTVCDLDERILNNINLLARKYRLKIETKKIDVSKGIILKENFVGFLTNPPYTYEGVKTFVRFGKKHLGKSGGCGFLVVGDECIGHRFLFLQEFFTKENLIILEKINGKIFYPQIELYKEDKEIKRRLGEFLDEKTIDKISKLGTSLYIFEYLPQQPKRLNFKKSLYTYL